MFKMHHRPRCRRIVWLRRRRQKSPADESMFDFKVESSISKVHVTLHSLVQCCISMTSDFEVTKVGNTRTWDTWPVDIVWEWHRFRDKQRQQIHPNSFYQSLQRLQRRKQCQRHQRYLHSWQLLYNQHNRIFDRLTRNGHSFWPSKNGVPIWYSKHISHLPWLGFLQDQQTSHRNFDIRYRSRPTPFIDNGICETVYSLMIGWIHHRCRNRNRLQMGWFSWENQIEFSE